MPVVAAVQMEIGRDKEANLAKASALLAQAAERGADLAVLPEYFLADCPEKGMTPQDIEKVAEPLDGPCVQRLAAVAKKARMYVCAGSFIQEDDAGRFFNTSVLLGRDGGIVGTYSKMHPENADPKFEVGNNVLPGEDFPVFETDIGKVAVAIDMDIATPETPRIHFLHGAEILCVPLNWSARWYKKIETYPAAQSAFNVLFTVVANRSGTRASDFGVFHYNGGSSVINPEGVTVARVTDYFEGLAVTQIDFGLMRLWRETIIPRDYPLKRRPQTYGALLD